MPDAQAKGKDRNPTEPKIKGQDYEFLRWAMAESQRRKMLNGFKRWVRHQWQRARRATPAKVMRKLGLSCQPLAVGR